MKLSKDDSTESPNKDRNPGYIPKKANITFGDDNELSVGDDMDNGIHN